jgi:hypothetical protein
LLEDMRHADFTLSYGAGRVVATGQAPPAAARALSQTLLAFLDAHLPARRTEERLTLASDGWSLAGDLVPPDGEERVHPRVDPARLAVVGSSYSGEAMMEAGRATGWAAAYVGLSPGSLSDESIAAIDRERLPWLLVVCRDERHLKEVEKALRGPERVALGIAGPPPGQRDTLVAWTAMRCFECSEHSSGKGSSTC